MENLVENLIRWNLHPDTLVTHRFSLSKVGEAYELMDKGDCGKVAVCFDEEILPEFWACFTGNLRFYYFSIGKVFFPIVFIVLFITAPTLLFNKAQKPTGICIALYYDL